MVTCTCTRVHGQEAAVVVPARALFITITTATSAIAMSNTLRIFVVGGHGKVALHFTRYAAQAGHRVQSMIRQPEHASDLPIGPADNVQPVVASLEATPVEKLAQIFKDYDPNVVLFAAGK